MAKFGRVMRDFVVVAILGAGGAIAISSPASAVGAGTGSYSGPTPAAVSPATGIPPRPTSPPGVVVPRGVPTTGVGGASHSDDPELVALGGLALVGAGAAIGQAIRRRGLQAQDGLGGRNG
jgi:hypothetical protein